MSRLKFVLICATLSYAACLHIKIDTPVAYIQPPEVLADGDLGFGVHLKPIREHTVTNDASERPPVFINKNEMYNQTTGDFSFGISDDFQASLGLTELFGALARFQYQLVGVPRSRATTGWSMSVNAELGYDTSSKDGDQSSTFGPGGYKWSSRTTMSYAGGGLSMGIEPIANSWHSLVPT